MVYDIQFYFYIFRIIISHYSDGLTAVHDGKMNRNDPSGSLCFQLDASVSLPITKSLSMDSRKAPSLGPAVLLMSIL